MVAIVVVAVYSPFTPIHQACKLLQHISSTKTLEIHSEHVTRTLYTLAPQVSNYPHHHPPPPTVYPQYTTMTSLSYQVLLSIETLASFLDSKIARENVDVFNDAWSSAIDAAQELSRDIDDAFQGRSSGQDRRVYLSLPRPGVSTTTHLHCHWLYHHHHRRLCTTETWYHVETS